MECSNCSASVADDARFCMSCGAATDAASRTGELPAVTATTTPDEVVPPQVDQPAELRACPACGAGNSTARVLCGRCGVDLDTGSAAVAAVGLHQPGPAPDVVGDVTDADPSPTGRTAWVVAAIVVLGAAAGVTLGLFAARSDEGPEVAAATFDAAVYTGEPEALEVSAVGASSTRPGSGGDGYDAANLVDGDLATAWSHDPAVEAATEVDLAIVLDEPSWVTALTFGNGAQVDDPAFDADGRVLRLGLVVDGERVAELQLLDQPGLQRVTLPEPQLVTELRLVVVDAVAGATYDEVSISEIEVLGHTAVGEDLSRMLTTVDATGGDATG